MTFSGGMAITIGDYLLALTGTKKFAGEFFLEKFQNKFSTLCLREIHRSQIKLSLAENFTPIGAAHAADFNKPTKKVFTSAIYNGRRYQQDVHSSRETNHSGGKQT